MSTEQFLQIADVLLKQWAFFALFVGMLYWFIFKYVPQQDALHKEQLVTLQQTFKSSLQDVVNLAEKNNAEFKIWHAEFKLWRDEFRQGFEGVNKRLDSIEEMQRKKRT